MNHLTIAGDAFVPRLLKTKSGICLEALSFTLGFCLLAVLARIAIPLPFTPVPITGQTFGVALVSLLWGRKRALCCLGSYVGLGLLGLPVFSQGSSGWGTTGGYLIGMVVAAWVVGGLADRGWSNSFPKAFGAAVLGSVCIFICGLFVLYLLIPDKDIFYIGLFPFIPGDIIKNIGAATFVSGMNRKNRQRAKKVPITCIFSFLFFGSVAMAGAGELIFFESKKWDGSPRVFEPGGRFTHVGILVGEEFYHAHPVRGVEKVPLNTVRDLGVITSKMRLNLSESEEERLKSYIGLPYDNDWVWDESQGRLYCSEYVAKVFKIRPITMITKGGFGISPDEIFSIFEPKRCVDFLMGQ